MVRRELRSYGYSYYLLNEEPRSYSELPDNILAKPLKKSYGKSMGPYFDGQTDPASAPYNTQPDPAFSSAMLCFLRAMAASFLDQLLDGG